MDNVQQLDGETAHLVEKYGDGAPVASDVAPIVQLVREEPHPAYDHARASGWDDAIRWARHNRDALGRDVLDRPFNPYRPGSSEDDDAPLPSAADQAEHVYSVSVRLSAVLDQVETELPAMVEKMTAHPLAKMFFPGLKS